MRDKKVAFKQKCRQELKNSAKRIKKQRKTVQIRIQEKWHKEIQKRAVQNETTMSKVLDEICSASLRIFKEKTKRVYKN